MIDLEVKHEGDGRFVVTSRQDWETAKEEIPVGEVLRAQFTRRRSSPENRLLHGAIKSAYDNQRGGPLYGENEGGWRRLRAWLLVESGHFTACEFQPGSLTKEAIEVLKKRDNDEEIYSSWSVRPSTGVITCKTPRTIKFSVVSHHDFQPIKTEMLRLLTEVICPGTTPEQLMEERYTRPKLKRASKPKQASQKEDDHAGQ